MDTDDTSIPYLPTPAEIVRECAEIRSRWSEDVHHERSMFPVEVVLLPMELHQDGKPLEIVADE